MRDGVPLATTHAMSADALLFELLDTLNQAFPRPPSTVDVRIQPNAAGEPALADLNATVDDDAPLRPNLGRTDAEILDAISQMLGDLGAITEADAGFVVTDGRIDVHQDDDAAIHVWLVETTPGDDRDADIIRLKRRFDRSEQNWLVHTPELFARLNATESKEEAARKEVEERLGDAIGIGLDLDAGTCLFRHAVLKEEWTAPAALLGSYANHRRALLWGWANDVVPPSVRQVVDAFKRSCSEVGLRAMVQAELPCPLEMADRLVRHAATFGPHPHVLSLPFSADRGDGVLWVATTLPDFD